MVRGWSSIWFDATARYTLKVRHGPFWSEASVSSKLTGPVDSYPAGLYHPPLPWEFRVGYEVRVGQKLFMAIRNGRTRPPHLKQGLPHEHKMITTQVTFVPDKKYRIEITVWLIKTKSKQICFGHAFVSRVLGLSEVFWRTVRRLTHRTLKDAFLKRQDKLQTGLTSPVWEVGEKVLSANSNSLLLYRPKVCIYQNRATSLNSLAYCQT